MTKSAEVYACLYAREFPAQALLRLRPELRDVPCVVMEGEPPTQHVCSLNAKGRLLGLTHGMTSVEVDTFSTVVVLTRSEKEEASAKAALLACAGAFSPRVADRSESGAFLCVLDIAGTETLLGPAETAVRTLLHRIKALGVAACAAVSSNHHAAICAAKGISARAAVRVIPKGDEAAALAPLPLTVLGLSPERLETFSHWGIRTLGMLAALPEKELIARMGQEGKRLRLAARGELPHLFQPTEPAFTLEEHIDLDSPVEILHAVLFVIGMMLEHLILRAEARVLALASVTVSLTLEGNAPYTRTIRAALPTNDKQLWVKLIHLDLEAHPPQAAILALTITGEPGSTSKIQLGLFSPQLPEPMRLDVTLARIRSIVGDECVGRAVLTDTHRKKSFRMEPFTVSDASTTAIRSDRSPCAVRQLRPAENVSITLQARRPTAFVFRDKRYIVERAYGPWLTGGEWWNPTLWGLEQWDLVARAQDGALLSCCLVCDLIQNRWQMEALYD